MGPSAAFSRRSRWWLAGATLLAASCQSAPARRGDPAPPVSAAPASRPSLAPPLAEAGQFERALRERSNPAEPVPAALTRYWRAVAALHLDNDAERADAWARDALANDPGHARSLALRCVLAAGQGRFGDVVEHCAACVARAPSSPEALVCLATADQAHGEHPDHPARLANAALSALDGCRTSATSPCGELSALALAHAVSAAGRHRDVPLHQALLARAGAVTRWRVAGPHAPLDVHAFRVLGGLAASGIPPDVPAPLPAGGPFHSVVREVPDGVLRPALLAPAGLYTAHSHLRVARPDRVLVDVRSTGSVRVWVDGVPVATLDRWASHGPPRVASGFVVVPGWHVVSVEAAVTARDTVEVLFLGEGGSSPVDAVAADLPSGVSLAPRVTPTPAGTGSLAALRARADADPADIESALGVVTLARAAPARDAPAARWVARQVARRFPASAAAWAALAVAEEADLSTPAAARAARSRRAWEEVLARNPASTVARHRLASLRASQHPDEALSHLRALVATDPGHGPAWRSLFDLYRAKEWPVEGAQALERALALSPPDRLYDAAASFFAAQGELNRSRALKDGWAAAQDSPYSSRTALLLADRLDDTAALAEWQRLLRLSPDHPDQADRLALLRRSSTPAGHAQALEEHLKRFPADQPALEALCLARRATGETRALKECLDVTRTTWPGSLLPDRLEAEAAGTELGEVEPDPPPTARALMGEWEADMNAGAAYLQGHPTVLVLDRVRRVLKSSGASWFARHKLLRVGTRDLADRVGELKLGAQEERRVVRVFKADGRVVEPEPAQGKEEVSLSGLTPGDFLELRTVGPDEGQGFEGQFQEVFYLAGPDPVTRTEYVLESPESLEPLLVVRSPDGRPPVVSRKAGTVRRTWRALRVAPVQQEPFSAPALEYLPRVLVQLRVDAATDARTTCRRFAGTARPTPELMDEVSLLRAGGRPPAEVLEAVLARVRSVVEPALEPLDAATSLANGRGYHLTLARALLRHAGIPARVVVGRTGFQAQADVPLPQTHDLPMLVVPLGDRDVVLSSVGPWLLEGPVPPTLVGPSALEADCDEVTRVGQAYPLPPPDPTAWESLADLDLVVTPGGDVTGNLRVTLVGPAGAAARQVLAASAAAQVQQVLSSVVGEAFPGAVVRDFSTSDLAARAGPLELRTRFAVSGAVRPAGDVMAWDRLLERPVLKNLVGGLAPEDYLRVPSRNAPLWLSRPLRERVTARVTLPAGSVVVRGPRAFRVEGKGYAVAQEVRLAGVVMELTRVMRVDVARVLPEDYPAFRAVVEQGLQAGRNRLEYRPATAQ
jgi:tetratricopeptide (TPR) repeat protein